MLVLQVSWFVSDTMKYILALQLEEIKSRQSPRDRALSITSQAICASTLSNWLCG